MHLSSFHLPALPAIRAIPSGWNRSTLLAAALPRTQFTVQSKTIASSRTVIFAKNRYAYSPGGHARSFICSIRGVLSASTSAFSTFWALNEWSCRPMMFGASRLSPQNFTFSAITVYFSAQPQHLLYFADHCSVFPSYFPFPSCCPPAISPAPPSVIWLVDDLRRAFLNSRSPLRRSKPLAGRAASGFPFGTVLRARSNLLPS